MEAMEGRKALDVQWAATPTALPLRSASGTMGTPCALRSPHRDMQLVSRRPHDRFATHALHTTPLEPPQRLVLREVSQDPAGDERVGHRIADEEVAHSLRPRGAPAHLPVLEGQLVGRVHTSGQVSVGEDWTGDAIPQVVVVPLVPEPTIRQKRDNTGSLSSNLGVLVDT